MFRKRLAMAQPQIVSAGSLLLFSAFRFLHIHGQCSEKLLTHKIGQSAPVSRQSIVQEANEECSNRVEEFALEAGVADFWTKVYPDQRRLALAYINEAFARLGCPLDNISPGTAVSIPNGVLPKHKRL